MFSIIKFIYVDTSCSSFISNKHPVILKFPRSLLKNKVFPCILCVCILFHMHNNFLHNFQIEISYRFLFIFCILISFILFNFHQIHFPLHFKNCLLYSIYKDTRFPLENNFFHASYL